MRAAPLPSDIYLDASIMLSALIGGLPHSTPCTEFCARLAQQNSRIYFAPLARLEIANALRLLASDHRRRLPVDLRQQFQLDQWATARAVRLRWLRFGLRQLDALLSHFEFVEIQSDALTWAQGIPVIARHNLKSYDAFHIATARAHGLRHFATTDRDFRGIRSPRIWLIRDAP
jgi:predicted nucleic acid-binding protein